MHISEIHRFVFLRLMRTGSTSAGKFFEEHYSADALNRHPSKHSFLVPDAFEMFYTFTIIRNPFDRLASLWLKARRPVSARVGHAHMTGIEFSPFIKMLLRCRAEGENSRENTFMPKYALCESQASIISRAKRIDKILRFEAFPECLVNLPFVSASLPGKFYRMAATPDRDRPFSKHYDDESLGLARVFCADDCERFGYECL